MLFVFLFLTDLRVFIYFRFLSNKITHRLEVFETHQDSNYFILIPYFLKQFQT